MIVLFIFLRVVIIVTEIANKLLSEDFYYILEIIKATGTVMIVSVNHVGINCEYFTNQVALHDGGQILISFSLAQK